VAFIYLFNRNIFPDDEKVDELLNAQKNEKIELLSDEKKNMEDITKNNEKNNKNKSIYDNSIIN